MNTMQRGGSGQGISSLVLAMVSASIGAGAAIAVVSVDRGSEGFGPAAAPEVSATEFAALERRVDALTDAFASAGGERAVVPGRAAADGGPDARAVAFEERLARLERSVQAALDRGDPQESGGSADRPLDRPEALPADTAQRIEAWQNAIVGGANTEAERLQAWRGLRGHENAYTDAVVAQMVHLGLTASDPETRADVWRQADGRTKHDALVPALLQAVQSDADRRVREEAAETLVEYSDRPAVEASLRQLLASETDEGVRRYLRAGVERAERTRGR